MKLVQAKEAARITGLTRQTIQNWIQKGTIKVHKINKANFIDADTLIALADTIEDVRATEQAIKREKELFEQERLEYEQKRHNVRDKIWRIRYLFVMANSTIRTDFYKTMVHLMCAHSDLTEREGQVLTMLLEGVSYSDVAKEIGITLTRIQQIASNAIRKAKDLSKIQKKLDDIELKDAYIEDLKMRLDGLKSQLVEVENTKLMREKMDAEEYVANKMREDNDLKILRIRIVDLCQDGKVSVRAANSCNQLQIETIADLASCNRSDILKARNCGKKTLFELIDILEIYGLKFGIDTKSIIENKKHKYMDEWKMLNS